MATLSNMQLSLQLFLCNAIIFSSEMTILLLIKYPVGNLITLTWQHMLHNEVSNQDVHRAWRIAAQYTSIQIHIVVHTQHNIHSESIDSVHAHSVVCSSLLDCGFVTPGRTPLTPSTAEPLSDHITGARTSADRRRSRTGDPPVIRMEIAARVRGRTAAPRPRLRAAAGYGGDPWYGTTRDLCLIALRSPLAVALWVCGYTIDLCVMRWWRTGDMGVVIFGCGLWRRGWFMGIMHCSFEGTMCMYPASHVMPDGTTR
jgi:hypothetical protein